MIKNSKVMQVGSSDQPKRSWTTPAMVRIEAGAAEISTRTTGDGPFSTS